MAAISVGSFHPLCRCERRLCLALLFHSRLSDERSTGQFRGRLLQQTLATVGYGEMYPATPYGRIVASSEIVFGLAFTAILTGLTFVRFSRPQAKLIFAANPVVAMYKGKPTLMVRVGNGRTTMLTDAAAPSTSCSAKGPAASCSAARTNCGSSGGGFRLVPSLGHSCMC